MENERDDGYSGIVKRLVMICSVLRDIGWIESIMGQW